MWTIFNNRSATIKNGAIYFTTGDLSHKFVEIVSLVRWKAFFFWTVQMNMVKLVNSMFVECQRCLFRCMLSFLFSLYPISPNTKRKKSISFWFETCWLCVLDELKIIFFFSYKIQSHSISDPNGFRYFLVTTMCNAF